MKYHISRDKTEQSQRREFIATSPQWNLADVVLSTSIADQFDEVICFIENSQILLEDWEFKRFMKQSSGVTINFYGPPGTGKTITADAIAEKLGKMIIKVNYADIESKYLGETSKNLQALFEDAVKKNSVLFFDEADSILGRRIANVSHAADYGINAAKSTLLTLLDSFSIVVIFATNIFRNYDSAFLRRILFHIEFQIPDVDQRTKLWELHLPQKVPKNISYRKAAELSEGLSGGDIRNLSIKLALQLLTERISMIDEDAIATHIGLYNRIVSSHREGIPGAVSIPTEEAAS